MGSTLVWLRDDLRVADNPALAAAAERAEPIVVLYVLEDEGDGVRALGGASRWWLHSSLESFAASLHDIGLALTLRRGRAEQIVAEVAATVDADAVYWNRRYGAAREIDARIKSALTDGGLQAKSFQASLLFEPWTIMTTQGAPFQVFTPFWRACLERGHVRHPVPAPSGLQHKAVESEQLGDWALEPRYPDWAAGLREHCAPGEAAAHDQLERFVDDLLEDYHRRDEPALGVGSGLSPYLRFGEISPFQVWDRMHARLSPAAAKNRDEFLRELGWREFDHSILFFNVGLANENVHASFDAFPWEKGRARELAAWQQGRTGIPLVDAGMRELWQSGTMHNRVRMVTASFLVKNLLVDWRVGEQWFWDTLVDADEANNPANWQWVAGSGADAAPYFRVFNPVLQASKFDPDERYVRRWVPEYGTDGYPDPMVDLAATRKEALAAYEHVRNA